MVDSSFNFFKLLVVSAIAGTVSTLLMVLFASLHLIHPYEGLIRILDENQIDSSADFTSIGTYFDYWNLVTFAVISGNFLNLADFTLTNAMFLLALTCGCITIALISGNFLESLISTFFFFLSLMIISLVMAQFSLVQLPTSDFTPAEMDQINQMKQSVLKLTFLIPLNKFIQLGMTFTFCVVMTLLFSILLKVKQRRIPKAPPVPV